MAASASLLTRTLDPEFEQPGDATSERILDAALALAAATGVRQKWILSKFSKPLIAQPSSVSSSLPVQAAGTDGTEPNHAARSP